MALALLTTGPHTVRASRLAFTTPVREAGGAGHWITLGHHDEEEGGGVHVYIAGGSGPGSGTITKGPKSLVGHHIAALASHPSVSKAQHHPVGHEPPGARDHPHYTEREATPKPEGEPTKRPGKPYARLSGAEQGTRAEQVGKALTQAQSAAKGAKPGAQRAGGPLQEKPQPKMPLMAQREPQAQQADAARAALPEKYRDPAHPVGQEWLDTLRDLQTTGQRGGQQYGGFASKGQGALPELSEKHKWLVNQLARSGHRTTLQWHPGAGTLHFTEVKRAAEGQPGGVRVLDAQGKEIHRRVQGDVGAPTATQPSAKSFARPSSEHNVADTAVAHQQAQAELAAHRAKNDRNPNPWAPHLSPPVGDAKDRELAEKATRAQLAHQAAQAQQQGAQQQQQQEGQRAHEKEMLRLKASSAPSGLPQHADAGQPVVHSMGKPGETDEEREQRLLGEYKQHKARFDQIFRTAHNDAGFKERRDLTDRMNDIGGEVQAMRDKRQGQQPPQAPAAAQQRLSTPTSAARPKMVPAARAPRASAADKQAALEHVNRELGDSDVHAPTHKDITRRLKSGELAPEQAHAATDAAYDVASTGPSDWHKFGDSIHHLHAQKAQNAERLREMQGYLKEHQRTPKKWQIWPAHGQRESMLAASVDAIKDHQARIEQAIARHGKSKVRESASPAPRFCAPVAR